ncbi:hypothetical protein [Thiolinea disciformis]|uniref:hypothetical protein n=1 Tax=Thiolinea disciformis TaxID=125614 RepID=UPI00036BA912|nr:hypothetical protein [Thiolinea disciformis]
MANECLFFAEDVFGGQFCLRDSQIYTFDPETGAFEWLAHDLEGWAKAILSDYEMLTGYVFAHHWQEQHGSLLAGKRLLPKIPFVLGGEFILDNLYLGDAVTGMRFRASLAHQMKDLPNGTQIRFNIIP